MGGRLRLESVATLVWNTHYTSILTLLVGIPASVIQQVDSSGDYSALLPLSATGNIAGVYAVVVLWSLIVRTIQGRRYGFTRKFRWGVAAGVYASACLIVIYGWPALVFGVIPPLAVALHFVLLQRARWVNA
jgi:hypothetical protein